MDTEVQELRRRVEHLEEHLGSVEHRLDISQMQLEIVTGWRQAEHDAKKPAGAVDQEEKLGSSDLRFGRVESMLRSVLLHQGDQAADLRRTLRSLQILVERKVS